MVKNLVIVESPSKCKTIEKHLGKDYKVVSSKGHIRDLAISGKYGFGVDLENKFNPTYDVIKGKKKVITDLKKVVNNSEKVYLATDPDREGEAISWHLKDALGIKEENYERVIFNEITKDVVKAAFKQTRKIDDDLVRSQETRRILDRIIGFRLSKLMQAKTGGKSAGRVQSVALRLIVEREKEINAFVAEEYWTIKAYFNEFEALLEKYNQEKIEIKTELEAKTILEKLSNAFKIDKITKKKRNKNPKMPFITSSLQQEASNKLNFSAKKTMMIAQKLYEGIDIGTETTGLITYMRTDSTRMSSDFINKTFQFIETKYGQAYLGVVRKGKATQNVQDAHEAIRPTDITRQPEQIKSYLKEDEYKLYSLIYARALASLMKEAKVEQTTVILDNNNYQFKATGQTILFDGYLKVYSQYETTDDKILPPLAEYKSGIIVANEIKEEQHFTSPPARYTEARLIKEMEELGIGRPSTYAKIIDTLKARYYVKIESKRFFPTTMGIETIDKLLEFFDDLINVKYTAEMEKALDEIAEEKIVWHELLEQFYTKFAPLVDNAFENMKKKDPEYTGEECPECGHQLVLKTSKYGTFTACSNYPACKYIKNEKKEQKEIMACPECSGMIVEKRTRKGKIFYGCNNYPKCNFALWDQPTGTYCPNCKKLLVNKKEKVKCSNCEYEQN